MAHNIMKSDKGIVGFLGQKGGTWHNLPQYQVIEGAPSMQQVRETICFPAELQELQTVGGIIIPEYRAVCRLDTMDIIGGIVKEGYEIVDNEALCLLAEMLMNDCPNLRMDSAGTLMNGGISFMNLTLVEYMIDGDYSPCVTKMLISQGLGGIATVNSGLHDTRIVCDNTRRLAEQQAAVNGTLKKFKHTKSVHEKLATRVVEMSKIIQATEENILALNQLAKQPVSKDFVQSYLKKLFTPAKVEGAEASQRAATIAENRAKAVEFIFENKVDLQPLADTKYKVLQAVTDWADHKDKHDDEGSKFMSNYGGTQDEIKQKGFQLLFA